MEKEVSEIDGIGPSTEESLEEVGITSVEELAESSIEKITESGMSASRAKKIRKRASEKTIIIQSTSDVEEEYENKKTISTGIDALDEVIEGGWQEEAVISIYGDSSTGKTQLCMLSLVEAVRQTNEDAIYIETEKDRYRPQRIESICNGYEDIDYETAKDKIHRVKAHGLDKQRSAYDAVANEFEEVSIVVVDSLVAQIRLSDQFQDRSDYGKRSNLVGNHLKAIEDMSKSLRCPALFTNQIYEVPDSGGPYQKTEVRQYGGLKIQYVAQYSVFMEEGHADSYLCNVEAHPSTGDSKVNIIIKEHGIEEVGSED